VIRFQFFAGMHNNRRVRQLAVHDRRIAPEAGGIRQKNYLDDLPYLMQQPRRNKTIAAIVALAAEDNDPPRRRVVRENMIRHGCSRIFHQRERGNAEAFASGAIDGAHFFAGDDLHGLGRSSLLVGRWQML